MYKTVIVYKKTPKQYFYLDLIWLIFRLLIGFIKEALNQLNNYFFGYKCLILFFQFEITK